MKREFCILSRLTDQPQSKCHRLRCPKITMPPIGVLPVDGIEAVVLKVMEVMDSNTRQQPLFGKIKGMEDENGTFFFVPKGH